MERTPCTSSVITSHGYDAATRQMELEFPSGKIYRYEDVDPDDYHAFANAKSIGAHFGQHIRPAYTGRVLKS